VYARLLDITLGIVNKRHDITSSGPPRRLRLLLVKMHTRLRVRTYS